MTEYTMGSFGVLNIDDMEDPPFTLLDGGMERRFQEKYDFCNEKRPEYKGYLFQYTLSGSGYLEKGGICSKLGTETGFFVQFPEQSRYYLSKECETAWEFVYLHFDGTAVTPFADKMKELCKAAFQLKRNSLPVQLALQIQNKMINGYRLQKYEGGEFVHRFLCALLREIESPSCEKKHSVIYTAVQIMEREYMVLESIENLARELGISFAHFTRCFRKEMGISPIRYLTNLRIQAAMNGLLNTDETLDAIAEKNGFSNSNYFCKVFCKNVGMSPTEYRRRKR